jgi:hypothetical protein
MNNNRGSAVAIVLMVLAVISLLGVGLLTQSRLDVRLTSAIKSYDKMFSLADGASAIAFNDITYRDREWEYSGAATAVSNLIVEVDQPNQTKVSTQTGSSYNPVTDPLYGYYYLRPDPASSVLTLQKPYLDRYKTVVKFEGYSTDPEHSAGWEISEYYPEYMLGRGAAARSRMSSFGGENIDEAPKSTVDSAVSKMKRKN